MLDAKTTDDAFKGRALKLHVASGRRFEFDSIGGNDLALIQMGIVGFNDLSAQTTFHHANVIAALAFFENGCAMRARIGDA